HKQLYWSHLRKFGQGSQSGCVPRPRRLSVCANQQSLIWKYGLNMYCQCFRQYAKYISFVKLG
ncbi:40S ribosomal protein S29-like, partial [Scyliorhinus canicula]|uniref:40S ribosomal protein S29-like n=1 Tax=Scyliorhinus canicula TaxID=7830 RepID=UPI0018F7AA18